MHHCYWNLLIQNAMLIIFRRVHQGGAGIGKKDPMSILDVDYYPIPGVWQHFRYLAFYSTTTEPPVLKLPQNMRIFGLCLNINFFFEKVDERWRRSTSGAQKRKVPGDWKRCNGESHQNVQLPHVGSSGWHHFSVLCILGGASNPSRLSLFTNTQTTFPGFPHGGICPPAQNFASLMAYHLWMFLQNLGVNGLPDLTRSGATFRYSSLFIVIKITISQFYQKEAPMSIFFLIFSMQ